MGQPVGANRPGRIVFSVIPSAASRPASSLKVASSALRWAVDSSSAGIGSRAALDETFRMRPNPRSRMPGTACSISAIGASTSSR